MDIKEIKYKVKELRSMKNSKVYDEIKDIKVVSNQRIVITFKGSTAYSPFINWLTKNNPSFYVDFQENKVVIH